MSANSIHSMSIRHRRTQPGIACTYMVDGFKATISMALDRGIIGSSNWQDRRLAVGSWGVVHNRAHLNLRATKIKVWPSALTDAALVKEMYYGVLGHY